MQDLSPQSQMALAHQEPTPEELATAVATMRRMVAELTALWLHHFQTFDPAATPPLLAPTSPSPAPTSPLPTAPDA